MIAALDPSDSSIAGTVTDSDGSPLAGVTVEAWQKQADTSLGNYLPAGTATTNSVGAYTIGGLAAGTFKIAFDSADPYHPSDAVYARQYWPGAAMFQFGEDIVVGSSAALVGKDAELSPFARISGTVMGTAAPVDHYGVRAYRLEAGGWWDFGMVWGQDDGSYDFQLPAGTYRIKFYDVGGFYAAEFWKDADRLETATSITLGPGEQLAEVSPVVGEGSHITGTLTIVGGGPAVPRNDGDPVPHATVRAGRLVNGEWDWSYVGHSDKDGNYDVPGLIPGTYRLSFSQSNFGHEYWDDVTDLELAKDIVVGAEQTISGKDADLAWIGSTVVLRTAPVLSGHGAVGGLLTISTGSWTPGNVDLSYVWKANGAAIAGAVGTTFSPTSAEAGKTITVQVNGERTGFKPVVTFSNGVTVAPLAVPDPKPSAQPAALTNVETPVITGGARVGSELLASPGAWSLGDLRYRYSWTIDGTAVPTNGNRLVVPANALGKTVAVTVTATRPDGSSSSATSTSTSSVRPGRLALSTRPALRGRARVGNVLTVNVGRTMPRGTTASVQWRRDGVRLRVATDLTYRLTRADRGHKLSATITYSRYGYHDRVLKAGATQQVRVRQLRSN
jgi:hypothetical protein